MGIEYKTLLLGATVTFMAGTAMAHGDKPDAGSATKSAVKAEQKPFGIAGNPAKVTRTVKMDLSDKMRFHPSVLQVKRGETVRFVVANSGKVLHEMVIGTLAELQEHAALMQKFPDMEHDEPYMAHVKPGATEQIVWQFNRSGKFNYACLVAGHFEAGMVGKVIVK
jgi:uncharacterized cupredoxin-like copper-binding protein